MIDFWVYLQSNLRRKYKVTLEIRIKHGLDRTTLYNNRYMKFSISVVLYSIKNWDYKPRKKSTSSKNLSLNLKYYV